VAVVGQVVAAPFLVTDLLVGGASNPTVTGEAVMVPLVMVRPPLVAVMAGAVPARAGSGAVNPTTLTSRTTRSPAAKYLLNFLIPVLPSTIWAD
jgi:hypothetical protein